MQAPMALMEVRPVRHHVSPAPGSHLFLILLAFAPLLGCHPAGWAFPQGRAAPNSSLLPSMFPEGLRE